MTVAALLVSDEVRAALDAGRPVVALESSLIAQGLPPPHNLETALAAEAAVREAGAIPATTALEDGRLVVGADRALLERLADPDREVAKAGSRDLGPLLAGRRLASTTVSATMRLAHLSGIVMFATGGIGGVHRGASSSFDVSSDIDELAATPVAVVSSGAKSILDLPATLEMLETRRVPVIGYGVDELPGFYSIGSGLRVPHRVDGPKAAAAAIRRPPRAARRGRHPDRPATARRACAGRGRGRGMDRGRAARRGRLGRSRRRGHPASPRLPRPCLGRAHTGRQHRPDRQQRARRGGHCIGLDLTGPDAMLGRPLGKQVRSATHANLRRQPATGLGRGAAQHR